MVLRTDRPVIFFDVDGVLLEYTRSFLEFCFAVRGRWTLDTRPKLGDIGVYDLFSTGHWPTKELLYGDMAAFNDSNQWLQTPALVSMTALESLKNVGYEVRALTMVSATDAVRARRVIVLSQKFGPVFNGVHFCSFQHSKLELISHFADEHPHQDVLGIVEDKPDTLIEFAESPRFRAFGVKHQYNCEAWGKPGIEWFESTDEVCTQLLLDRIKGEVAHD